MNELRELNGYNPQNLDLCIIEVRPGRFVTWQYIDGERRYMPRMNTAQLQAVLSACAPIGVVNSYRRYYRPL